LPAQLAMQLAWQIPPAAQLWPAGQMPHFPPQPSGPQPLPAHAGWHCPGTQSNLLWAALQPHTSPEACSQVRLKILPSTHQVTVSPLQIPASGTPPQLAGVAAHWKAPVQVSFGAHLPH